MKLDRDTIRGCILVGATLPTSGLSDNEGWNIWWAIAVIIFSALTTVMIETFGVWWAIVC